MIGKTFTATHSGFNGKIVSVEAACHPLLPSIQISGLAGEAIKESRERIRSCLNELGFSIPSKQIVVHLFPANEKKQGSHFDLSIALAILAAEGELSIEKISSNAFLGELTLEGRLRGVRGALSLLETLEKDSRIKEIYIPKENSYEAHLLKAKKVKFVNSIFEVIEDLKGNLEILKESFSLEEAHEKWDGVSIDEVKGQSLAKRALQIALAGRHSLLMMGAPGVGKSMLAQSAIRLLPLLNDQELIEVEKIYSLSPSVYRKKGSRLRPYRSPHHSASPQAILGGGNKEIIPGEISLSSKGILFLDELPEFRQDVLEGLREPLQTGHVHLCRVGERYTFPAETQIIAAMNPCPCGHSLEKRIKCICPPLKINSYRRKLSGPLLDRFGLFVYLSAPINENVPNIRSEEILKKEIIRAWENQENRSFELAQDEERWLNTLVEESQISMRRKNHIIKIARTIADLADEPRIRLEHLLEAWSFRCPDSFHSYLI